MDDILKLASQFGGAVVPEEAPAGDIAALASQFGGTIAQTPGGYGAGTFAADITKNVAAGAIPGDGGSLHLVEAGIEGRSRLDRHGSRRQEPGRVAWQDRRFP